MPDKFNILDNRLTTMTLLDNVAVAGPGPSFALASRHKTIGARITGVATVLVEVSTDNATWFVLSPACTTTNALENSSPWAYIRGNVLTINPGATTTVTVTYGVL